MVLDKAQVRWTGPVNPLTHQPVKGRKRHGGIRLGEMERDSLLSHGVSFLLRDRLLKCSDHCMTNICNKCGSLLSLVNVREVPTCRRCNVDGVPVEIPYVLRYLAAELAAMNIKLDLRLKEPV